MWPPGSANTVCPRPPLMTQVQHFVSWIKKSRDETYRRCELMTLTFDLGGHRDCLSYASWYFVRVRSANFGDTTTVRFWFMGHTAQTDYVTLTFDLGGHGACGWCGSSYSICIPSLKFVGLFVRKIWGTMCESINGPGNLDLLILQLVGNLPSKFGHARPLDSGVIRYVRDGRTDGQTDRQTDGRTDRRQTKATLTCPLLYGRGIINGAVK